MKRALIIGGVAIAVAIGTWAVFVRGKGDPGPSSPASQLQREAILARGDLDLTVSADGVVQPINKVEVKSKASGQIFELNVVEGQEVTKGDLLIALDQKTALNDYDQAKADLELAEANATQQENNYRRSAELFDKSMISQQERDLANVESVRAKSSLVKARAALSSADERLRDTRIRAPIDGIVLTKNVEIGQIISSGVSNVGGGTLLATLADMSQVYVETNVDEVDIGRIAVGQSAKVVADAYPDDSFTGEVIRIAPLGQDGAERDRVQRHHPGEEPGRPSEGGDVRVGGHRDLPSPERAAGAERRADRSAERTGAHAAGVEPRIEQPRRRFCGSGSGSDGRRGAGSRVVAGADAIHVPRRAGEDARGVPEEDGADVA